jgi:hypothetical protein
MPADSAIGVEPESEEAPADPDASEDEGDPEGGAEPEPADAPLVQAPTSVGGFSSAHPGIVMFAMGDGSVRVIRQTIDTQIYQQLGHRNDGKLLDDWE